MQEACIAVARVWLASLVSAGKLYHTGNLGGCMPQDEGCQSCDPRAEGPVAVLALMLFNIVHLFSCFIVPFLELKETKHLLPMLLHLLMDSFKVIDLTIKFLVSRFWVDGLPLLAHCFLEESIISLVRVQGREDNVGYHHLLWRHSVGWCGCEITGGERICWSLAFDCYM
jgi:hypothetical protein